MLSVYETAVNIRWFVVKPRSHFENKMALKGLSFDKFKKSAESILCSFQNVKIHELSPHQSQALYHFISGEDTFVVLPTGHGKSLIYQMSVHYAKEVESCVNPIVFVISPLNALICDQIRECERVGLNAMKLEASNIEELRKECKYNVIFSSAEVLESFSAAKMFLQSLGSHVVDESHCVVKWYV